MLPKLHSDNYEGMELIRPMYYIREQDIIDFRNRHNLTFIQCACKFTEGVSNGLEQSKRAETKALIHDLLKMNPQVEQNIFKASENVILDKVLGYKDEKGVHTFLDDYDE
jgi:tRNA(Ile)-lysidine synthase TilS/MesJ